MLELVAPEGDTFSTEQNRGQARVAAVVFLTYVNSLVVRVCKDVGAPPANRHTQSWRTVGSGYALELSVTVERVSAAGSDVATIVWTDNSSKALADSSTVTD